MKNSTDKCESVIAKSKGVGGEIWEWQKNERFITSSRQMVNQQRTRCHWLLNAEETLKKKLEHLCMWLDCMDNGPF